jgi:hypothetical protein
MGHLTAPVLKGLKEEISRIGLDSLRTMDDPALAAFYTGVVEQYAVGPQGIAVALVYLHATEGRRVELRESADITNPEVRKGLLLAENAIASIALAKAEAEAPATRPIPPRSSFFLAWDPMEHLTEKAFNQSGKITPETLARAYVTLQDSLRLHLKKDGQADYRAEQMIRLKEAFTSDVSRLDYIAENACRGVNIIEAEPALVSFRQADGQARNATCAPQPPPTASRR